MGTGTTILVAAADLYRATPIWFLRIKQATELPVAVGFGVNTPEQARAIAEGADGVVVGSALVNLIADSLNAEGRCDKRAVGKVTDLVSSLAEALRAPQNVAVK